MFSARSPIKAILALTRMTLDGVSSDFIQLLVNRMLPAHLENER